MLSVSDLEHIERPDRDINSDDADVRAACEIDLALSRMKKKFPNHQNITIMSHSCIMFRYVVIVIFIHQVQGSLTLWQRKLQRRKWQRRR